MAVLASRGVAALSVHTGHRASRWQCRPGTAPQSSHLRLSSCSAHVGPADGVTGPASSDSVRKQLETQVASGSLSSAYALVPPQTATPDQQDFDPEPFYADAAQHSPAEVAACLRRLSDTTHTAVAVNVTPLVYAAVRKLLPGVQFQADACLLKFCNTALPEPERIPGGVAVLSLPGSDPVTAAECCHVARTLGVYAFPVAGSPASVNRAALAAAGVVLVLGDASAAHRELLEATQAPLVWVPPRGSEDPVDGPGPGYTVSPGGGCEATVLAAALLQDARPRVTPAPAATAPAAVEPLDVPTAAATPPSPALGPRCPLPATPEITTKPALSLDFDGGAQLGLRCALPKAAPPTPTPGPRCALPEAAAPTPTLGPRCALPEAVAPTPILGPRCALPVAAPPTPTLGPRCAIPEADAPTPILGPRCPLPEAAVPTPTLGPRCALPEAAAPTPTLGPRCALPEAAVPTPVLGPRCALPPQRTLTELEEVLSTFTGDEREAFEVLRTMQPELVARLVAAGEGGAHGRDDTAADGMSAPDVLRCMLGGSLEAMRSSFQSVGGRSGAGARPTAGDDAAAEEGTNLHAVMQAQQQFVAVDGDVLSRSRAVLKRVAGALRDAAPLRR